jgi:transposase
MMSLMAETDERKPMETIELHIGVDLHERESQVAVYGAEGGPIEERRIPTPKLAGYIGSLPGVKHVGIESIGFIYPVYDGLVEAGCDVWVANPNNVQQIAKTRIKHDKVDARILGELLRAGFLPRSHIPVAEAREKRLLVKERVRYGVRAADVKNSVRWMLKRRGLHVEKPFTAVGRAELKALGLMEFDHRLRELELLESMIEELDRRILFTASRDRNARLLDTIPGVGPYTALHLATALDPVDRFPDSKHACAYVGLVPSLHQSGDRAYSGHITRQGDRWLRRNVVECVRWTIKKDRRVGEFHGRVRRRRGGKMATVAVARKIVSYAYWMLKSGKTYEELHPWVND